MSKTSAPMNVDVPIICQKLCEPILDPNNPDAYNNCMKNCMTTPMNVKTPLPNPFTPAPKHKSGLSKEAIAGIIVGSVTLLLIVAVSINSTKGGKKRGKRRGKKGRKK